MLFERTWQEHCLSIKGRKRVYIQKVPSAQEASKGVHSKAHVLGDKLQDLSQVVKDPRA
jgi:hypothetical protein